MTDIAIDVRRLSKQYQLGERAPYQTLRDTIVRTAAFWRRSSGGNRPPIYHWALRDVSFEVKRGEVLGIIGRNGAGKSTLLKILSRITEPTQGEADIRGRVGSLLEVGTGFHAELSGRENIYLNGAILGMRHTEIAARFDEIVAFADIDRFIDTPVKFYSSGMYMRLAFAVAAHLDPEILIVDEVLAVGDAEFQKKCLRRMGDVARSGRTILFVSHNMAAIQKLCTQCVLLDGGVVRYVGDTNTAVQKYLTAARDSSGRLNTTSRTLTPRKVAIVDAWLEQAGMPLGLITRSNDLEVIVVYEARSDVTFVAELLLRQQDGVPVAFSSSGLVQQLEIRAKPGRYTIRCRLPDLKLAKGEYGIDIMASELNVGYLDHIESAIGFSVDSASIGAQGWNYTQGTGRGFLYWDVDYQVVQQSEAIG